MRNSECEMLNAEIKQRTTNTKHLNNENAPKLVTCNP